MQAPRNSARQKGLFALITIVLIGLFCELAFRLTLKISKEIPFVRPDLAVEEHFYKELKLVQNSTISADNDSLDILVLGGSVVADEWRSKVARYLQDSLRKGLNTSKVRYFNLANLGHTTSDNLYKYKSLKNKHFDLVIYYEGINETRFNNVPASLFRSDYTHVRWYHDIALIKQHPEMRYTVIPFMVHLFLNYASTLVGKRYFINDAPDERFYSEAFDVKTAPVYQKNLTQIVATAQARKEPLLLVNFTYYIPEKWRKSNFKDQEWDYAGCDLSSPIRTWGTPLAVEKGILAHRAMMQQVANAHKGVHYMDMMPLLPREGRNFCDICHLTDDGCRIFSNNVASYVLKNNVIRNSY
ncbi:hypothetical protein [Runella sp. SP2]|uniref:hypothetical protein n=1 Tax=Runella sp. SP2 TaxID=2268026 RepID=UPI000F0837BE|nr:hypothetical protein [Runella sp. SP2]AYQ30843.1 hypothetical protein DTQ70_00985 [Runella sp. SP2]